MKSTILILSLILSTSLFAANTSWDDLELYKDYTLKQDIVFENGISFKSGERFQFADFISGEVPVMYYEMFLKNCKHPEQTAELILVNVGNTVIGAQLYEGCNLGLFLEVRDYYSVSPFEI